MWYGMHGMGWGMMGFGWIFGGMFFLLVIALIIFLIVRLARGPRYCRHRHFHHGHHGHYEDDPLEILKHRYAKGEITKEQYEDMKKDLS